MNTIVLAVCYLGGGVALSVAGAFVVRRLAPHNVLEGHKEVAGFLYAVVGAVYAVVLALAVVGLWEEFREAEEITAREANKVLDLFRLSGSMPAGLHQEMHQALHRYVRRVVDEEWPAMRRKEPLGRSAELDGLWRVLRTHPPTSDHESLLWDKACDVLIDLSETRRLRAVAAVQGLPAAMWFVLVSGAVLTIGFSYFFGVKSAWAQLLLTATLSLSLTLQLFLLACLEYPFSGVVQADSRVFELVSAEE